MVGKNFLQCRHFLRNPKLIGYADMIPFNLQSTGIAILEDKDISYLNPILLGKDGLPKVVPYDNIKNIPNEDICLWCVRNGVYQIPTSELIEFLRNEIGNHFAIEICAGHGHIGRSLGIPMTDSYMQTIPEIMNYYNALRQKPIHPPNDVMRLEAVEAVETLKPEIVIGCFATHKYQYGDENGSQYGVNEEYILGKVKKYIHIGNRNTHRAKRILKIPNSSFSFPWIVSRAIDQSKNAIWIWEMQAS